MADDTAFKSFAEPSGGHASLGWSLRLIVFLLPLVALGAGLYLGFARTPAAEWAMAGFILTAIVWKIAVSGIRVVAQWEKGVVLRFGKYHTIKDAGIVFVVPIMDYVRFVDMRVLTLNIPSQKVITKDNVPAQIDGVLFFRVSDAERAVIRIQDFRFAIAQYAQASLRDVVGNMSLDELLTEREQIQQRIAEMVEQHIKDWGVHVDAIRLLDIEMPEELKRMMSRQASAEREKRATITKAEGDRLAAQNLADAAAIIRSSPGAMQLRTFQTIDGLGSETDNTIVLFPVELSDAVRAVTQAIGKKPEGAGGT